MFLQTLVVIRNGTHKEAHGFGRIPRSPFLTCLFKLNARWGKLANAL
jgi:hypothetical protein